MDWISFTSTAASHLIQAQQRGEDIVPLVERHNRDFARSYERWFQAIYQDKYYYMGEFDLMRIAFLFDVGLYIMGVASQPFKRGAKALREPVFSTPPSIPFFHFMRSYNRRLARIAETRSTRNRYGLQNANRRFLFPGFTFASTSAFPIAKGILAWALLELTEGWRTWFGSSSPRQLPINSTASAPATAAPLHGIAP
jgi:hypothetical protein